MSSPQVRSDGKHRRIGTTFTDNELIAMDEWGFARKIRNRSEVIRQLVRKGLEAEKMATTGDEIGVTAPADAEQNNTHEESCSATST